MKIFKNQKPFSEPDKIYHIVLNSEWVKPDNQIYKILSRQHVMYCGLQFNIKYDRNNKANEPIQYDKARHSKTLCKECVKKAILEAKRLNHIKQ